MALRYQKRINLGKGAGVNISKTGVSYSQHTRHGSIGTRGFSIKTGIPGLTFRKNWGKGGAGLGIMVIAGTFFFAGLVVYNLIQLVIYLFNLLYNKINSKEHGN